VLGRPQRSVMGAPRDYERTFACFCILLLASAVSGGDRAARFLETEWVPVPVLADVSPMVIAALRSQWGSDVRLAARGEAFDATDVVSGAPSRRFVLAGREGSQWFLVYEQGGRGHHLVLAMFEVDESDVHRTMLARGEAGIHDDSPGGWLVTVDDLRSALSDGRLLVEGSAREEH